MKHILIVIIIATFAFNLRAQEAFVVLEGNSHSSSNSSKVDIYNPFLKDSNYSVTHVVKPGDSLSGIINKYYKDTGLNLKVIQLTIIEINKKAFVRNNPNYLYSGKKIKIPSINQIMNLVKNNRSSNSQESSKHIYFFGGF